MSFGATRTTSGAAVRTNQLVEALAHELLAPGHDADANRGPDRRADVQGAVRLCVRILTSHIGEPLMLGDEASVTQVLNTRLVKAPSPDSDDIHNNTWRFKELHQKLRLLDCVKNRASMLHLLYKLADSDVDEQRRGVGRGRGVLTIPPRVFTEPAAGLSGIDRVGREKQSALRAPVARAEEGSDANGGARSVGMERHRRGRVRGLSEVTERALLRGILYAFQGIDSQHIKYCEEASGYVLDPGLRLGPAERSLVSSMLEMGWLFTEVVRYIQGIDGGLAGTGSGLGPGRVQQAFVFSLKEDMTEYYRLMAVLEAQLNLDAERAGRSEEGGRGGGGGGGGSEGLTLRRLAVWVVDPLERLKLMATLVAAAAELKGGPLASCLHTHMQHGDAFVRGLVQRTMVRVCEPLFFMIRNWVFEGELIDHHQEFFVQYNPLAQDEMLWQERYKLEPDALPKFIEEDVADKILVIGKAINFLRRLCGDSEWIMGPMAKAAAQTQTLEYGNTASLRAVVDCCSTLTNARLVQLMLGHYRLRSHLKMLKKFLLHGQGDLMLSLVEVLGAELNKKASAIFSHNVAGIVDGVIKTNSIAQEEPEDVSRVKVRILSYTDTDTGWQVFSMTYELESPLTAVVHSQAMLDYRRVFHVLWRIKRVEWSLASAWRLHTSATHVRIERALPELKSALHRCSLVRGQMVFLTTNLSNYMMFEVLETSWGSLQERLDSAKTLDDVIDAHNAYLSNIHSRALLNPDSKGVYDKLIQVLQTIIEFCAHQETLIIRAMAEVTTQGAERAEVEQRTARGQWGLEGEPGERRGGGRRGPDPFGMGMIEDTAKRYEEALSELVRMLEEKSAETEILRFLTFRLDFNDYYKGRRAAQTAPPARRTSIQGSQQNSVRNSGGSSSGYSR